MIMISTTSPKVIVKTKFQMPSKNKYIVKDINKMIEYFSNPEKQALNMFDYYNGNIKGKRFNLVLEDGHYANYKDIREMKQNYLKYIKKGNLWKGIISFNNDYINQNIKLEDLEQKVVKEVLPRFFKECGFKNMNNLAYSVALHTDTDNLHFHFCFIEKKPNYITKNNKLSYRIKGKLSKRELDYLKDQVVLSVERGNIYKDKLIQVSKDIDELKTYFNPKEQNFLLKRKDLLLEDKIYRLGELVENYRNNDQDKFKYNCIKNKEIKKLVNDIKDYLFKDNSSPLYKSKLRFNLDIKSLNDLYNSIKEQNHLSNYETKNILVENKKMYLDNYVCNAILNHANYINWYGIKDKINDDDVILSVVSKITRKLPKKAKKDRLKQMFNTNNRYPIKKECEQAIKNTFFESQKAIDKFHELFINDEYNYVDYKGIHHTKKKETDYEL